MQDNELGQERGELLLAYGAGRDNEQITLKVLAEVYRLGLTIGYFGRDDVIHCGERSTSILKHFNGRCTLKWALRNLVAIRTGIMPVTYSDLKEQLQVQTRENY